MGNIGGGEIIVILLVALLVLGPQKLPDAAKQLGKAVREFRNITSGFQRELRDAMNTDDVTPATVPSGLPHTATDHTATGQPADAAPNAIEAAGDTALPSPSDEAPSADAAPSAASDSQAS